MSYSRVSFNIPGLDDMLDGGLHKGRPYVLAGPPGTGKTTLAVQMLAGNQEKGTEGLMIAIERPVEELMRDMKALDLDVENLVVLDANAEITSYEPSPVRDISARGRAQRLGSFQRKKKGDEVSLQSIHSNLRQELAETRYGLVVIDSLTGLEMFCPHGPNYLLQLMGLFRFLSEKGVTTLVVQETPARFRYTPEMRLAYGIIRMEKRREGQGIVREISIPRMRGGWFDRGPRTFSVGRGGIEVD